MSTLMEPNDILNLINQDKLDEAEKYLLQLKESAPNALNIYLLDALIAAKHNKYFHAIKYLQKELELFPENTTASDLLNQIYSQLGWYIPADVKSDKLSLSEVLKNSRDIKTILWFRVDLIGDNIITAGMLPFIKDKFPNAKIVVICTEQVANIYSADPCVDKIETVNIDQLSNNYYRFDTIKRLQSYNGDLAINTVFSRSIHGDYLTLWSGCKFSIAFEAKDGVNSPIEILKNNSKLFNHIVDTPTNVVSELKKQEIFLRALDIKINNLQPRIYYTCDDVNYVKELANQANIEISKSLILAAGASTKLKRYPYMAEVINYFCQKHNLSIVALGSKGEWDETQKILDSCEAKSINLCGKTTIRQSAAVISLSPIMLGNDSGLSHVANAVKTPNVICVGGMFIGRYCPATSFSNAVMHPIPCYACHGKCVFEDQNLTTYHCVSEIPVNVVKVAIDNVFLQNKPYPEIFISKNANSNQNYNNAVELLKDEIGLVVTEVE